jgi:two-component system OmpR family sensor kinase
LRLRLSLLSLGVLLALLLVGGAFQYVVLGPYLQRDAAAQLGTRYSTVMANELLVRRPVRSCATTGAGAVRPVLAGVVTPQYADCLVRALGAGAGQASVVVLAPDGGLVTAEPPSDYPTLPVTEYVTTAQKGPQRNHWLAASAGGQESLVILRVLRQNGRAVGMVQLGVSTALYEGTRRTLLTVLGLATGLLMLVAAVITPLLVGRALRPLHRVTEASTALAAGDLARRVEEPPRADELGTLARAFNRMAAAMQSALNLRSQSESRMRRFVADASHELRTPLTTIQGQLDLLRRGAADDPGARRHSLESMGRETQRMSAMVEDLLTLTRLDSAATGERETVSQAVDVNALVAETVEEQSVRAPEQRVDLELSGGGAPLVVAGDRDQLRRLVLNLANNALKYAPGGTHTWRSGRAGETVTLSLSDAGPGIPEADLPRIFDRFYRGVAEVSARATGSGLGLAIVRSIAEGHGGAATVANNPAGGATFTITLPAAD